jgi:hypothetical protein
LFIFYDRPCDLIHNRQHSLHLHPDGAEDEEEEDHHLVHEPGLGRLLGHYVCHSRYIPDYVSIFMIAYVVKFVSIDQHILIMETKVYLKSSL